MILVAKTVVYKHAMMIKLLNTSIAEVAVIYILRSKVFAENTYVI